MKILILILILSFFSLNLYAQCGSSASDSGINSLFSDGCLATLPLDRDIILNRQIKGGGLIDGEEVQSASLNLKFEALKWSVDSLSGDSLIQLNILSPLMEINSSDMMNNFNEIKNAIEKKAKTQGYFDFPSINNMNIISPNDEITASILNENFNNLKSHFDSISTTINNIRLNNLTNVNSDNVENYNVSGICSPINSTISLTIGALSQNIICDNNGDFNVNLNLSTIEDNNSLEVIANNSSSTDYQTIVKDAKLPTITLETLISDINSNNQNNYNISGQCSENDATIDLIINSGNLSESTTCLNNSFSFNLDNLSTLDDGLVTFNFIITDINLNSQEYNYEANKDLSVPLIVNEQYFDENISFECSTDCFARMRIAPANENEQDNISQLSSNSYSGVKEYDLTQESLTPGANYKAYIQPASLSGNESQSVTVLPFQYLPQNFNLTFDILNFTPVFGNLVSQEIENSNPILVGDCGSHASDVRISVKSDIQSEFSLNNQVDCLLDRWSYQIDFSQISDSDNITLIIEQDLSGNTFREELLLNKDTSGPVLALDVNPQKTNNMCEDVPCSDVNVVPNPEILVIEVYDSPSMTSLREEVLYSPKFTIKNLVENNINTVYLVAKDELGNRSNEVAFTIEHDTIGPDISLANDIDGLDAYSSQKGVTLNFYQHTNNPVNFEVVQNGEIEKLDINHRSGIIVRAGGFWYPDNYLLYNANYEVEYLQAPASEPSHKERSTCGIFCFGTDDYFTYKRVGSKDQAFCDNYSLVYEQTNSDYNIVFERAKRNCLKHCTAFEKDKRDNDNFICAEKGEEFYWNSTGNTLTLANAEKGEKLLALILNSNKINPNSIEKDVNNLVASIESVNNNILLTEVTAEDSLGNVSKAYFGFNNFDQNNFGSSTAVQFDYVAKTEYFSRTGRLNNEVVSYELPVATPSNGGTIRYVFSNNSYLRGVSDCLGLNGSLNNDTICNLNLSNFSLSGKNKLTYWAVEEILDENNNVIASYTSNKKTIEFKAPEGPKDLVNDFSLTKDKIIEITSNHLYDIYTRIDLEKEMAPSFTSINTVDGRTITNNVTHTFIDAYVHDCLGFEGSSNNDYYCRITPPPANPDPKIFGERLIGSITYADNDGVSVTRDYKIINRGSYRPIDGSYHTCYIKPNKSIFCGGRPSGSSELNAPNVLAKRIYTSRQSSCIMRWDDKAHCWGNLSGIPFRSGSSFNIDHLSMDQSVVCVIAQGSRVGSCHVGADATFAPSASENLKTFYGKVSDGTINNFLSGKSLTGIYVSTYDYPAVYATTTDNKIIRCNHLSCTETNLENYLYPTDAYPSDYEYVKDNGYASLSVNRQFPRDFNFSAREWTNNDYNGSDYYIYQDNSHATNYRTTSYQKLYKGQNEYYDNNDNRYEKHLRKFFYVINNNYEINTLYINDKDKGTKSDLEFDYKIVEPGNNGKVYLLQENL